MAEARLTPLAKGLIVLIILGGAGTAAWHLGVKDMFADDAGERGLENPDGDGDGDGDGNGSSGSASGPIGSDGNPLKVSIVSFHGYAPALVANGNSLTTQPGSLFDQAGTNVEFVIQDNIPTLTEVFESGAAHCAWRTSDFWAQEQPNLRNNELDARAVVVVDNTQGGDAVIARDPSIRRIEDLVGKRVALLQFTPSHGMLIHAVENSSLSARQKRRVLDDLVFINIDEGTGGVRAALEGGNVDAAVLWDPDLSLALSAIQGAHVIYSTRVATNLIYDVMVCDKRVLDAPANAPGMRGFVKGWMDGVAAAKANPDDAVDALVQTEEFFQQLANREGRDFVKGLFSNLVWTGVAENARILGMSGGTNHYERVYRDFDRIYRAAGALANPSSPVVNPSDSFDYTYIREIVEADAAAQQAAAQPEFEFTEQERNEIAEEREEEEEDQAVVTRPVIVNFTTGSSELNERSKRTINEEMVPLIESHGSAYFEVSGNTDSTGSRAANARISRERAQAVVDFLVEQWEFPAERFIVVGNGPDKPLCDESAPEEGMSMEDCRARNRTTRVAILQRHEPASDG